MVKRQPATPAERRRTAQALFACPTGSIGIDKNLAAADKPEKISTPRFDYRAVIGDFPLQLEGPVYYCGFNSEKSYGGNSYFVRHAGGNWLIDSPRFTSHLVERFEEAGGLKYIFLSHRDDVADAAKYAREFRAQRIIHRAELQAQPGSEIVVDGTSDIAITPEFTVIPTPGHTRGHCCLLYANRFLFSGDHLDWDRDARGLDASRDYCWYSWPQQVASVERLLHYSFEWVLPGHGQRVHLPQNVMQRELRDLISRIR